MPNVAKVLRDEISRISRKEAKAAATPLRETIARMRKEIVALKRSMAGAERALKRLPIESDKTAVSKPRRPQARIKKRPLLQISSSGIKSLRRRLRVSQADFARLMSVTEQAVYLWERKGGRLNLRDSTCEAIAALKTIGAKEAHARLEAMPPRKQRRKAG